MGYEWDTLFRPVANINISGGRAATVADFTNRGIRPIL